MKGPWTREEDQKIIDCITNNITRWSEIAERVEGRVGKQCRERWFNHLDPTLKKSSWTPAEDEILVQGQARFGNRSVSWLDVKIGKFPPATNRTTFPSQLVTTRLLLSVIVSQLVAVVSACTRQDLFYREGDRPFLCSRYCHQGKAKAS